VNWAWAYLRRVHTEGRHQSAAVCQQLRKLHLTVWYNLYAERLPDLRPRAAELLALWPAP
jgi:hypothetical protein